MNKRKHQFLLYVIIGVILSTIGIQVYWNYKNYLSNKQTFINEVQISLDKAVDDYYAKLATKSTIGFSFSGESSEDFLAENGAFDSIIKQLDLSHGNFDTTHIKPVKGMQVFRGKLADSILQNEKLNPTPTPKDKVFGDSIEIEKFKILTSKVIISINNDSLVLKELDPLFKDELSRKQLQLNYALQFKNDHNEIKQFTKSDIVLDSTSLRKKTLLSTTSKSEFLPKNSVLSVYFNNINKTILKRILFGVLISSLLVFAIIGCLLYLLKIINKQKQLAEVKNDLISNITHEFKTPISTISVALESIKDFNVIEDKEKTKTYLNLSINQLQKLNVMVEKLLETATLDGDNLELQKQPIDLVELINILIERHSLSITDKTITFNTKYDQLVINADAFHMENAINNILDNAIKYGGNHVEINLTSNNNKVKIDISDNGGNLKASETTQIFKKFYRVSKGNTHDVKGFGIGLYYTKKIIEKHNGEVEAKLHQNNTHFIISLPNG
ncbi:MAG: hypothetical protein BM564_08460 [Bacteroidetes bacterium MedPE-SWsnd-G2]|nr:MAG: hypothetical protein BM564_08460 [Bacteroidetes bacterium MedPE-SWsnd-G2]